MGWLLGFVPHLVSAVTDSQARRDELASKAIGVWTRQPGFVWCGSELLSTAVRREDGDPCIELRWREGAVRVRFEAVEE